MHEHISPRIYLVPSALCFIWLDGSAWHGYQLCVRSVVFCWLRHERSGKHGSLGASVRGDIGHMAYEISHFCCCCSPLPDVPPTHPSSFLEFFPGR